MLGSMVILVIVCLWHCLVTFDSIRLSSAVNGGGGGGSESGGESGGSGGGEKYVALKSFALAYVVFHIAFALWLYYDVSVCVRITIVQNLSE